MSWQRLSLRPFDSVSASVNADLFVLAEDICRVLRETGGRGWTVLANVFRGAKQLKHTLQVGLVALQCQLYSMHFSHNPTKAPYLYSWSGRFRLLRKHVRASWGMYH